MILLVNDLQRHKNLGLIQDLGGQPDPLSFSGNLVGAENEVRLSFCWERPSGSPHLDCEKGGIRKPLKV